MILLTVGTQLPFDRLVRAVDAWAGTHPGVEILGQTGPGAYRPGHFPVTDYYTPEEMSRLCDRADVIVSHAGMGSIVTALVRGKPIIVFPRRAALGEHRSDHQVATARHYERRGGIYVALDERRLAALLDCYRELKPGDPLPPYAPDAFIENLRALIDADG